MTRGGAGASPASGIGCELHASTPRAVAAKNHAMFIDTWASCALSRREAPVVLNEEPALVTSTDRRGVSFFNADPCGEST